MIQYTHGSSKNLHQQLEMAATPAPVPKQLQSFTKALRVYADSEGEKRRKQALKDLNAAIRQLGSMDSRDQAMRQLIRAAARCDDPRKVCCLRGRVSFLPSVDFRRSRKQSPRVRGVRGESFCTWEDLLSGSPRQVNSTPYILGKRIWIDSEWDFTRALRTVRDTAGAWLSWVDPIYTGDSAKEQKRQQHAYNCFIISTHAPHHTKHLREADTLLGLRTSHGIRAWRASQVQDVLEGSAEHLPLFPDSTMVDSERRSAILPSIKDLKKSALSPYMRSLSTQEHEALFDELAKSKNASIAGKLRESMLTVQRIHSELDSKTLEAFCDSLKGKRLSPKHTATTVSFTAYPKNSL